MIPQPQYVYRTRVIRVIDGDSMVLEIDLGCHVAITRAVRLVGIDTPEVVGATREAGIAAREWAREWLFDTRLVVETRLDANDKFGRLLATIWRAGDPVSLNAGLVAAGHAREYDGGAR